MDKILIKNTFIPKFMSCSCHEAPELNFIYHSEYPKFMVEVADSYDMNDINYLRDNKFLFKEVELKDGEKDLLVVVDFIDKEFLNNKLPVAIFDQVMDILDKMAIWHIDEINDLDNYKNTG